MRYLLIVMTALLSLGCQEQANKARQSGFREYSGPKYVVKGSPVAHRVREANRR